MVGQGPEGKDPLKPLCGTKEDEEEVGKDANVDEREGEAEEETYLAFLG